VPYATVADLPAAVRSKLKGKKLRQWMHVFNSSYERHGDESRAFAEAWATAQKLGKANVMTDFNFFLPIAKVDEKKRTVSGYASTPTRDSDGEIVTLEAVRNALPDYMEFGNIREMHALKAVGVAKEANLDTKGLFLTAKIVDDSAWKKCLEGVYKGFSIGGRKLAKEGEKITAIDLTEISVVDRPANPDCRIALAKRKKDRKEAEGYLVKLKEPKTPETKALAKMAKVIEILAKEGPPAAHDGFSLPAAKKAEAEPKPIPADEPDGVPSVNDSRPNENITRKTEDEPAAKGGDAPGEGDKPYGNVEYADPGYQSDKKKRYPVDSEKHIRAAWNYINKPKNAAKYSPANLSRVRGKILSAWKSKIDAKGPPSAKKARKAQKAEYWFDLRKADEGEAQDSFLTLRKGMGAAGSLAYCFDSLRATQRSLLMEAKREGGDMKDKALAKQLGTIAKDLANIISQKATHEGGEAEDMSDADDQLVNSILAEENDMDKSEKPTEVVSTGDPLTDAFMSLVKRAAEPSHEKRLAMAKDDAKECRKALKECRKAIEDCHKMHKAAYLSKARKGDKKPADDGDADDDGFDHTGAMEKLQKAYGDLDKARTFAKAVLGNITKAESIPGRSGQRGQEAGDPEAGFYEVPAGVKDLSPAAMSGAKPGTSGTGGQPPMYPGDGGVYPGKADHGGDLRKYAKNGLVPVEIAEMLSKTAALEAENEALRRLPAPTGRRPYAFDMTKVSAGPSAPRDLQKALFEGVDASALNGQDERAHTEASARVIGNLLTNGNFGKSVFDPTFKGAAGSSR
jgi:phage head maturation protease/cation transport regulator ChaB